MSRFTDDVFRCSHLSLFSSCVILLCLESDFTSFSVLLNLSEQQEIKQ